MANLDSCYDLINELVDKAGALIAKRNDERREFVQKSCDIDLVTETDKDVEKLLMDGIAEKFPTHKFIGEEETSAGKSVALTDEPTWIIDPVDGTMNFVHAFPHSCISVALLINKVTEIGLVFNPLLNQKFSARRGQGAFYNGKKISVSGQTKLSNALLITEFGTTRDAEKMECVWDNAKRLVSLSHGMRCMGSAALNLCMVAMGGADVNYEFGLHAWDMAAGNLIVVEAGGVVIDPSGGTVDIMSRRVLACSTQELADEIVKHLKQYYPVRD